jgi:hypothetical protein
VKRCTKGKSCGATCIFRNNRCVLELGPELSKSLSTARSKIGVVKLYFQVKDQGVKGGQAKFERIRKELAGEVGGRLNKTGDLIELQNRLKKEGLLPKSKKSDPTNLGDIFARQIEAGKKEKPRQEFTPLPTDLRAQLAALGPPRQLERSPGAVTKTPPAALRKTNTKDIMDDISRIMRGEEPLKLQLTSGQGELGMKARMKSQDAGKELQSALGFNSIQKKAFGVNPDTLNAKADRKLFDLDKEIKAATGEKREALVKERGRLQNALDNFNKGQTQATGNTLWARGDASDFDGAFKIYKRIRGDAEKEDWSESAKKGTKIGEGAFGTVMTAGQDKLHKRGQIGEFEAEVLKRVGGKDLGPKLFVAELATEKGKDYGLGIQDGRVSMSKVPGKPIGSTTPASKEIGGKRVADIYWKAMADLHRMGIAHNDAHIDNILVDDKGKGRWVDFGLAQPSPKAALAEAMGIFNTLPGTTATRLPGAYGQGNWQTRRWDAAGVRQAEAARKAGGKTWQEFMERFPVASRVWENRGDAQFKLLKMGLSKDDVSTIIDHGIRSTPESYTKGPWAKLTDKQAQEVLDILYDGI